ncbi:MAG: hypothetical protein H6696_10790 [Deferribacteres bacterium]|nr:hypothetical protein [candidate division KSB1 bacterium]MCB9502417.1 hypothetical protein [Deferribacteres bacterium]
MKKNKNILQKYEKGGPGMAALSAITLRDYMQPGTLRRRRHSGRAKAVAGLIFYLPKETKM